MVAVTMAKHAKSTVFILNYCGRCEEHVVHVEVVNTRHFIKDTSGTMKSVFLLVTFLLVVLLVAD